MRCSKIRKVRLVRGKWSDVVFTDEKKWNLDGPSGFHCYWHDLRKEKKIFKKRQSGGGSVMTWGTFCFNEIFKLVLVSGNMDSKQFTDILIEHFLEDFFRIAGNRANVTYFLAQLNLAFM